jgi:hypothetical protein
MPKATAKTTPARATPARPTRPPNGPIYLTCVGQAEPNPKGDRGAKRRNSWVVKRTGDWAFDCCLGDGLAREWLHYTSRDFGGPSLANVIRDMVRGGEFDGVEVGFLSTIAAAALRGRVG